MGRDGRMGPVICVSVDGHQLRKTRICVINFRLLVVNNKKSFMSNVRKYVKPESSTLKKQRLIYRITHAKRL